MGKTSIAWTEATWNPVRGCSRVSPGCGNCYAMRMAHRFSGPGRPYEGLTRIGKRGVDWAGRAVLVPEMLNAPLRWRKSRRVFVNSMSDLFHESLTNEEIAAVFGVMAASPMHTFQVLTKRAKRMREWFEWAESVHGVNLIEAEYGLRIEAPGTGLDAWPLPNVWLGVSAENQEQADKRIPELLRTPAAVRWVSVEPMIGPIDLRRFVFNRDRVISGRMFGPWAMNREQAEDGLPPALDWVVVGGESGAGARLSDVTWHRSLRDQCKAAGVAFFEKQLGSVVCETRWNGNLTTCVVHAKRDDRAGANPAEWPKDLRVREYPKGVE